jgi:LPS-assembly protein
MTPRTFRTFIVLTLVLAALSVHGQRPKFRFAPGPKAGGGDVKVTVEPQGKIEAERDEYAIFTGGVLVEYQDIKLRSDKVTLNNRTKDVVAEGHVIIDQGPSRVSATQAIYNLDSKTGTFFNATATMDPEMSFSGDRIEKVDEDTFRLTNGVFTSCDLDKPAWSFHVGNAEVTVDDYARMSNVSFRAGGIPVFWAPRLIWPTKRDRSRGFLIPRALFSDRFGERLELGYYVPMGDSADATVYADINTRSYNGLGLNLRYLPSQNIKLGELTAHVVQNPEPEITDPSTDDKSRVEWKYAYKHAQENLPGGFRGVVDIQDYSDLDFFREYDRNSPDLTTISNIYSSAYLTKNRPTYSLNVLADRRDIIFLTQRQRYEQLPSLQLRMYPQRVLGMPLYFSMETSSSHLRTSGVSATGDITRGADYYRTDIFPTMSLQLRTPAWFSVRPQISLRDTYYSASLGDDGLPDKESSLNRFYAQGQVEVVGPSFSRVFNRQMGAFGRFKHVIEPRFRYVYTTDVKRQNEIIRFDTVDSPFLPIVQDSVEYSLTQRVIGKEKGPNGSAREVMSFSLRQTVSLSEPFQRATTSGAPLPNEETHRFTPLTASLRVNPFQTLTLDASATFGNISHQLDQTSLSANIVGTGKHADKYVNLTWFATFRDPRIPDAVEEAGESSQVRINTGSSLLRDRVRADIQLNFDARNGKFLEQRFLLGGTGSCYGIALEYRRYLAFGFNASTGTLSERSNNDYGIAVTLKNVGTIGNR